MLRQLSVGEEEVVSVSLADRFAKAELNRVFLQLTTGS